MRDTSHYLSPGKGGGGGGGVGELWEEHRGNREVYSKWGVPVIIHRLGGGLQSRRTMRRTQGEQRSQKQMRGTSHYLSPGRGWGGVGGLGGGTLEYYRDSWKGSGKYEKLWCSDPRPAINNDRSLVSRKGPSSDTCVACVQHYKSTRGYGPPMMKKKNRFSFVTNLPSSVVCAD